MMRPEYGLDRINGLFSVNGLTFEPGNDRVRIRGLAMPQCNLLRQYLPQEPTSGTQETSADLTGAELLASLRGPGEGNLVSRFGNLFRKTCLAGYIDQRVEEDDEEVQTNVLAMVSVWRTLTPDEQAAIEEDFAIQMEKAKRGNPDKAATAKSLAADFQFFVSSVGKK